VTKQKINQDYSPKPVAAAAALEGRLVRKFMRFVPKTLIF